MKYIVTQHADDYDYNFVRGIYDDEKIALGDVFQNILDEMENGADDEAVIRLETDNNGGSFYNVIHKQMRNKNHSDIETVYCVFLFKPDEKG